MDTSVLLEATDEARSGHAAARAFIELGTRLVLSAQVIREFLVVATRPVTANGLEMTLADAMENVCEFRRIIRLLPEERPVLPTFLSLLAETSCRGKRIHDAHLVATAIAHRVASIVTLNTDDFWQFRSRVKILAPP